jgi:hypothetical protein
MWPVWRYHSGTVDVTSWKHTSYLHSSTPEQKNILHKQYSFFHGSTALVGLGFLTTEISLSHSNTPHSVGLLWTNDRPVAETSTWQHTTLTRDRHPWLGGIRTLSPSKRAAADPLLRQRSHLDRPLFNITLIKFNHPSQLLYLQRLNFTLVFHIWWLCHSTAARSLVEFVRIEGAQPLRGNTWLQARSVFSLQFFSMKYR